MPRFFVSILIICVFICSVYGNDSEIPFNYSYISKEHPYDFDYDYTRKDWDAYLGLIIPLGIKHFFYKELSNISYSIEAILSGGIGYSNIPNISDPPIWGLSFGVRPKFYIRWYF